MEKIFLSPAPPVQSPLSKKGAVKKVRTAKGRNNQGFSTQISVLKEQGKKKQRFCVVFSDFNALCYFLSAPSAYKHTPSGTACGAGKKLSNIFSDPQKGDVKKLLVFLHPLFFYHSAIISLPSYRFCAFSKIFSTDRRDTLNMPLPLTSKKHFISFTA